MQHLLVSSQLREPENVSDLTATCLAGHGTEDTFIAPRHSERLAAAHGCAEDCQLITFPGDHNSVRPQHFLAAVLAFFDSVLQCRSTPSAPNSVASSGWVFADLSTISLCTTLPLVRSSQPDLWNNTLIPMPEHVLHPSLVMYFASLAMV